MKRRLITTEEAVPAKSQHKKPCSDCPWARTALNGWLGGNTPEEWLQMAHGETRVECHALTGVQCAGIAIYRANSFKSPRDQGILRLPMDTKLVFANRNEFLEQHAKIPRRKQKPPKARVNNRPEVERVEEVLNEVEEYASYEDYREFLEEIQATIEVRLLAFKP